MTRLGTGRLEKALDHLEETGAVTSRLAETPAGPRLKLYSLGRRADASGK